MKIMRFLFCIVYFLSLNMYAGDNIEEEVILDPKVEAEVMYEKIIDNYVVTDDIKNCVNEAKGLLMDDYWTSIMIEKAIENNAEKCLKAMINSSDFKEVRVFDTTSSSNDTFTILDFIKHKNPALAKKITE